MDRIEWTDDEGDHVWLRVIYSSDSGGGYREATEADLHQAGYVTAKTLWGYRILVLVLWALFWVLFFLIK